MTDLENTTELVIWTLPTFVPSAKNIVISITLTIIVLTTLLGNLIVLIAFLLEPKLRSEAFNYFIFNLAITDFLVAITAMTFYTIDTVLGYWPFGPALCGFWIYADYALTFASVFTLTAISVDRFWSVTWPIQYRIHATVKKIVIMIAIVWICVFTIWTPPFIGDRLKHNELYSCIWEPNENREFIIIVDIIGHYLPCLVMVASYAKVFMVMRRRAKIGPKHYFEAAPTNNHHSQMRVTTITSEKHKTQQLVDDNNDGHGETKSYTDKIRHENLSTVVTDPNIIESIGNDAFDDQTASSSMHIRQRNEKNDTVSKKTTKSSGKADDIKYNKMEKKIFVTLSYVVISYLVCWFPFYVTWDIYAWYPDLVPQLLYTIMFWMTYINSTLNPLIYAYTNKDFRRAFLRIVRCKCR